MTAPVEQVDRIAAAEVYRKQAPWMDSMWDRQMREGGNDSHALVQAFAAARLAERERCAKVAEGFEDPTRDWVPGSLWDGIKRDTAKRIRSSSDAE